MGKLSLNWIASADNQNPKPIQKFSIDPTSSIQTSVVDNVFCGPRRQDSYIFTSPCAIELEWCRKESVWINSQLISLLLLLWNNYCASECPMSWPLDGGLQMGGFPQFGLVHPDLFFVVLFGPSRFFGILPICPVPLSNIPERFRDTVRTFCCSKKVGDPPVWKPPS